MSLCSGMHDDPIILWHHCSRNTNAKFNQYIHDVFMYASEVVTISR